MKTVFTTGEAAEICKVSQQTIIRCFDSGRLKGFRVPGSRFRRIPREALIEDPATEDAIHLIAQEAFVASEREWLGKLPTAIRFLRAGRRYLLCHGSPRRTNEFLWESASSDAFLSRLARDAGADQVLCTHTGIHWQRTLPDGSRFVNVGAVGRPANDGRTAAWYALLPAGGHVAENRYHQGGGLAAAVLPERIGMAIKRGKGKGEKGKVRQQKTALRASPGAPF